MFFTSENRVSIEKFLSRYSGIVMHPESWDRAITKGNSHYSTLASIWVTLRDILLSLKCPWLFWTNLFTRIDTTVEESLKSLKRSFLCMFPRRCSQAVPKRDVYPQERGHLRRQRRAAWVRGASEPVGAWRVVAAQRQTHGPHEGLESGRCVWEPVSEVAQDTQDHGRDVPVPCKQHSGTGRKQPATAADQVYVSRRFSLYFGMWAPPDGQS